MVGHRRRHPDRVTLEGQRRSNSRTRTGVKLVSTVRLGAATFREDGARHRERVDALAWTGNGSCGGGSASGGPQHTAARSGNATHRNVANTATRGGPNNPTGTGQRASGNISVVTSDDTVTAADLIAMLDGDDVDAKRLAASDPRCPISEIASRVAAAPAAPDRDYRRDEASFALFWGAAEHPDAPPEMLQTIARHSGWTLTCQEDQPVTAAAAHPSASPTLLSELADSAPEHVCEPVAANPNTRRPALRRLTDRTLNAAHDHGYSPGVGAPWVAVAERIAANPATDTADVQRLADWVNPAVRQAILAAPHTPPDVVTRIAKSVCHIALPGHGDGYSVWDLAHAIVTHESCDDATAATVARTVAGLPDAVSRLLDALAQRTGIDPHSMSMLSESATARATTAAATAEALATHTALADAATPPTP